MTWFLTFTPWGGARLEEGRRQWDPLELMAQGRGPSCLALRVALVTVPGLQTYLPDSNVLALLNHH